VVLPYYLSCVENHVCLSCGMQVIGAARQAAMRIVVGVGHLVQKTGDGQAHVGNSVVRRSRGRVILCVACTMRKETRSACFLVQPQNQGRQILPIWAQNRWLRVSLFGPQNRQLRFRDLGLKTTTAVSWFVPPNQVGYGLSIVPQNRWEDEDGTGHTSRSSGLLRLDASQASISQSGLKTGGGAVWMVDVTP
jgi:hypothetical protein